MAHPYTFGFLVTDIIYSLLTILAGALAIMYYHAYRKMKRSPMIKSVWVLMLAITIDSAFFAVTTIATTFHRPLQEQLVTPPWLIVPKLVFLIGLLTFMIATLSPNQTEKEKAVEIHEASDQATIRR
jgi:vacuolar-type H+-ATPase subunit I/STV1